MPRVYVPRVRGDVPVPYHIIGQTGTGGTLNWAVLR
jgi:hypothetical protein